MRAFISYSHKDRRACERLLAHLEPLRQSGSFLTWHFREITVGEDFQREIDQQLERCELFLPLISQHYLESAACKHERQSALIRREQDEVCVVPIVLQPGTLPSSGLGHIEALPAKAKAVSDWDTEQEAYASVLAGLGELLEERQHSKSKALYDAGSALIARYNARFSGARFIKLALDPRIEPAEEPFFEVPDGGANYAQHLADGGFENERLGVCPPEGKGIQWADEPLTVPYQSVAYSDVLTLREAKIRHNVISCNVLMIANDPGAIVLNRRSGQVGTHKGLLQVFGGGMVVGGPNVGREPDPDCWSAARREVREELRIDLSADQPPDTCPIYIGEDVESGYLQISYLGVPISKAQLTDAKTNWEGRLALIRFEDLESRLGQPEDFVPSGLMHIKVWLSLGAPGADAMHLPTLRRIEPWDAWQGLHCKPVRRSVLSPP